MHNMTDKEIDRWVILILVGIALLLAMAFCGGGAAGAATFVSPIQSCQNPQFFVVESVDGRDWDPDLRRFVTWQIYMRGRSDGYGYSVMTWWPNYVPGDVIRLCDGETYPYGEWKFTHLPLVRR